MHAAVFSVEGAIPACDQDAAIGIVRPKVVEHSFGIFAVGIIKNQEPRDICIKISRNAGRLEGLQTLQSLTDNIQPRFDSVDSSLLVCRVIFN
jgi:hypothetical protein